MNAQSSDESDAILGPGFKVTRFGRSVLFEKEPSPEGQRLFREWSEKLRQALPDRLRLNVRALETELAKFNSFDVIAHFRTVNLHIADPNTFKEYAQEGQPAYPEFVALLCLKHPFREGEREIIDLDDTARVQGLLRRIFMDAALMEAMDCLGSGDRNPPSKLIQLDLVTRLQGLNVRNPAYTHHLYAILKSLFSPFEEELVNILGFGCKDALAFASASTEMAVTKLKGRVMEAKLEQQRLLSDVRAFRRTLTVPDDCGLDAHQLRLLAVMRDRDLKRYIKSGMVASAFLGFGETCSFTSDALAEYAGTATTRAQAFLDALSLDFGSVPADFERPRPTHSLRDRPFVKHTGRYLAPSHILIDWAVQPVLESALQSGRRWNKYVRHRHDFLLKRGVELMTKMMPGCVADHHLMYGVTDSSGPKQCELDAILVFDSALFLVEAKAAGLSDSAKRGGRLRLKRELSEILGEAHAQGRRAERYLAATSRPVFTRATDGTTLSIERHDIEDIFLVTLTLEPLAHVSAALHSGGKSSLSADEGLPWVVNLYDLMVIADCVDLPPMFPHYIKRRLRVAEQGFLSAPEELDLFGFYLKEGLYFDGRTDIAPAGLMQLTSYTTEMDDYYLYSQGARTKPAPKPSQQMPDGFRNLIEAIMKTGAKGRVSAAMFLLDLDEDLRTQLIDKIKAAAKRHARDGAYHNVVMSASDDGGWGITYMVGPSADVLDKKLGSRCAVKKTLLKCRRWIGIGDVGRKSFKICAVVSLNDSPLQSGTPTISEKPGIATS